MKSNLLTLKVYPCYNFIVVGLSHTFIIILATFSPTIFSEAEGIFKMKYNDSLFLFSFNSIYARKTEKFTLKGKTLSYAVF